MNTNVNSTAVASIEDRLTAASRIISSATRWAAAAGAVPVPLLDSVALATVQGKMLADLSALYGHSIRSEVANGLVSVSLGTLLPAGVTTFLGSFLGSSVKAIPGVGTALGMISMASFGSAATYAIGKVFVRHFENGGTVANFSADAVKEDLKAEFTKAGGKQAADAV